MTKVKLEDTSDDIKELHLWLDFTSGYKFSVDGSEPSTAYDTIDKTWRHLNSFQHKCYLHARVPRVRTGGYKVVMVDVPWTCLDSGFTLLFEAYSILLIEEMPVSSVVRAVNETSPRIWRVFNHWVSLAFDKTGLSKVRRTGVDETSKRRGHDCITQFARLDERWDDIHY